MKYTFRWFGPKDPSKLEYIKQIGVSGIVTSLAHIQYGEKCPENKSLLSNYQTLWLLEY